MELGCKERRVGKLTLMPSFCLTRATRLFLGISRAAGALRVASFGGMDEIRESEA